MVYAFTIKITDFVSAFDATNVHDRDVTRKFLLPLSLLLDLASQNLQMISAIAARKAAQAAQNVPGHHETPASTHSTPLASPSTTKSLSNTSKVLKRKQNPNTNTFTPKTKKTKTQKKRGALQGRYFQETDVFQGQDDIIVIDSDNGDTSDDIEGVDADEVHVVEDPILLGKRAWSPSRPVNDSSDEEIGPSSQFTSKFYSPDTLTVLTTFYPVRDQNVFHLSNEETRSLGLSCLSSGRLFALQEGETVSFVGTYRLTVLVGSLSICGVTLSPSPRTHDVFAPRSSPLPVLKACSNPENESWKPTPPDRLKDIFQTSNTVFILQELRTNVEGLGSVCKTFESVFRPSRLSGEDKLDLRLAGIHMITNSAKDIHPYLIPPSWDAAMKSFLSSGSEQSPSEAPVYIVKGPKKSGKSSFAKMLLNKLVQKYRKVAFLECDIGQSEFTPGGMVSLNIIEKPVFGPPFTHPTLPNQAHYIGALTPRTSPSHYLAAIQALVQYYKLDVQTPVDTTSEDSRIDYCIPLVVNTMGWAKGLGADLTAKIEEMVQPSHIFEFEAPIHDGGWSKSNITTIASVDYSSTPRQHKLLEPITPLPNYSAVDHRIITLLSYFHAVFPSPTIDANDFIRDLKEGLRQVTACTWNTSLPLCAVPPFEVDVPSIVDRFVLCGAGSEDVIPAEIERVLNGAVVGLVSCDPGTLDTNDTDSRTHGVIPYIQGSDLPSPLASVAHGLALIRSLSPGGSSMHVITPVPSALLTTTRVFVKGEMELPVWGMLDFRSTERDGDEVTVAGVPNGKVPYLQWGKGEGLGGEKRRKFLYRSSIQILYACTSSCRELEGYGALGTVGSAHASHMDLREYFDSFPPRQDGTLSNNVVLASKAPERMVYSLIHNTPMARVPWAVLVL
ncbi:Polynucleotide 5'-hydroxyl-kinase grc3 [Stygiomarasmius scandens]|uniref:Polynucleotide 5'-hydroxyl-kinase GRC3 n=1 Tax=Marasmiellus scandens TaxID=2682957 RepID=A0ABR1K0F1_9AGAR